MQLIGNLKKYLKYCKLILTIVFIITAVLSFKPSIAYADDDYEMSGHTTGNNASIFDEDDYNGKEAGGQTRKLSYLYWAGTNDRTGYLMYFVDMSTGKVLSEKDLGLGKDTKTLGIRLLYGDSREWSNGITDYEYITHFGEILNVKTNVAAPYEMPEPVGSATGGGWKPNAPELYDYLFTVIGKSGARDLYQWEALLSGSFPNISSSVMVGILNKFAANENYTIVLEPLSAQTVFYGSWDERSINQYGAAYAADIGGYYLPNVTNAYDYAFKSGNCKPLLTGTNNTKVLKVLTTGMYAAEFNKNTLKDKYNVTVTSGEANTVWLHQTLPNCLALNYDAVTADGKHTIKATDGIMQPIDMAKVYTYDSSNPIQKNGYAMVQFKKTVRYIDTYDVVNKPEKPAKSQHPNAKTDGDCSITKLYFDIEIDLLADTITSKLQGKYMTVNTTGNINITSEKDKSGYILEAYALRENTDSVMNSCGNDYYTLLRYIEESPAGYSFSKNTKVRLNNKLTGEEGKYRHIYLVYSKTTTKNAPESSTSSNYDFEIPESYITKQVWFSKANLTSLSDNTALKFTTQSLQWVSDAFKCEGHHIFDCEQTFHIHNYNSELTPYLGNCTTYKWVYECNNNLTLGCGKEHTHGTKCLNVDGYMCEFCQVKIPIPANANGKTISVVHSDNCSDYRNGRSLAGVTTTVQIRSTGNIFQESKFNPDKQKIEVIKTYASGAVPSYMKTIYKYKDATYTWECTYPNCGATFTTTQPPTLTEFEVTTIVSGFEKSEDKDGNIVSPNTGKIIGQNPPDDMAIALLQHLQSDEHSKRGLPTVSGYAAALRLKSVKCNIKEHKCADSYILLPFQECELETHICLFEGCEPKTVYCNSSILSGDVEFTVKNTLQGNNPSIQANVGKIIDGKQSLILSNSPMSVIANTYKFVDYNRTEIGADDTSDNDIKFDYSTILLRGNDKLTLAQWKTENASAISNIQSLTNQFYVGNTPQGDRKDSSYTDSFSAKFENASSVDELKTTAKFTIDDAYRGKSDVVEETVTIFGIQFTYQKQVPYNTPCANQSRTYTLQTPYEIPTIKVKVNVFSDYTNQNPGTPIHGDTTISFYPYVRMYYDTPSLKNQSALVLGETQRQFQAHDGADITFTNGTGQLTLTTSQWYLAKMI